MIVKIVTIVLIVRTVRIVENVWLSGMRFQILAPAHLFPFSTSQLLSFAVCPLSSVLYHLNSVFCHLSSVICLLKSDFLTSVFYLLITFEPSIFSICIPGFPQWLELLFLRCAPARGAFLNPAKNLEILKIRL